MWPGYKQTETVNSTGFDDCEITQYEEQWNIINDCVNVGISSFCKL